MSLKILFALLLFSTLTAWANSEGGGEHGEAAGHEAPPPPAEEEETIVEEKGTIVIHEAPEEVMIPSKIWDIVFPEAHLKPRLNFVPVKLKLKEKNHGILSQEELIFQFPRGGGAIDLSHFVSEKRGSFFVDFELEDKKGAENSYVFFISRTRKRKVDGEILGSGCKKFVQVQKYLATSKKKGGILVNTTRLRHLNVLGGTFVFINVTGKDIHLAQVSFSDSKNPQYFCPVKGKGNPEEPVHESAEGL